MLFWFIKQTFFPPLPRIGSSLSLTKTSRGPGSDMGHVSQPHMDVDSSCLVYSAVQPLDVMDLGPAFPEFPFLDVIDLITLRGGLDFPASLDWKQWWTQLQYYWYYCCFSFLFCGVFAQKNWLTEFGRNIFIFGFSWANWLIKWPSQLGCLTRGPGYAAVRRFLHLLFSQMIWLYSY